MVIYNNRLLDRFCIRLSWVLLCVCSTAWAQIPQGYYNAAVGKSGVELQGALSQIIDNHTVLTYGSDNPGGLWRAFRTTDVRPDGSVWDIYSNCVFIPWEDGHITSSGECNGGTQQEHTFCQSWMNYSSTPLYSDMFHIYPVDAWVNGRRSNHPYGEVPDLSAWIMRTFQNGAKLGYNGFVPDNQDAFCEQVYEPANEYKGDIARGFFYIATRYMFEDEAFSTSHGMTNKSQLRPWALEMMRKWHRQDPVSQKEIDRNNNIYYLFQHNRNPYIDCPELVDLVFGSDSLSSSFDWHISRAPQALTVIPDTQGRLYATLQWQNPTKLLNNQTADSLLYIKILRNDEVVQIIQQPVAGAMLSWMDYTVPTSGYYEYKVLAVTNAGPGLAAQQRLFVGQSCPIVAHLTDASNDGWKDGAHLEFQDADGQLQAQVRLSCGSNWGDLFTIPLPATTIQCVWVSGSCDNENGFILLNSHQDTLFAANASWSYDTVTMQNQLHSDVENIQGLFFTFDNNSCSLDDIPNRCFDTVVISLQSSELPYHYQPADYWLTFDNLSNPSVTYCVSGVGGCDSIITVLFQVPTSIEPDVYSPEVDILPNPTTGKVLIVVNDPLDSSYSVQIWNLSACMLGEHKMLGNRFELDLSHYPEATYLIKVIGERGSVVKKVVFH